MGGSRGRARRRQPHQGGRRRTRHSGPLRRAKRPMPHDREEAAAAQRQRRRHAPGVRRAHVAGAPPLPVLAGKRTEGAGRRRGRETLVGKEAPGSQSPQRVTVTRPRPLREQPVHLCERARTRARKRGKRHEHVVALRCACDQPQGELPLAQMVKYLWYSLNRKTELPRARLPDDRRTGVDQRAVGSGRLQRQEAEREQSQQSCCAANGSAHAGGTSKTQKTGTPGEVTDPPPQLPSIARRIPRECGAPHRSPSRQRDAAVGGDPPPARRPPV